MEFSFNTLTAFPLVRRRRSWAPWARVEGSARWCDGPSNGGFNSQSGVDRGSCRALMLMTCTAMKCGANRTLKEWVRQVQFEFVHNVRVRSKELNSTAPDRSPSWMQTMPGKTLATSLKRKRRALNDMHF